MAQVNVTINGRVFRMGCDEGQEEAIADLARDVDQRIEAFRTEFGEVGDMRLMIMAALALGDELGEARRRLGALEAETARLRDAQAESSGASAAARGEMAAMIDKAAQRIERIAASLNGADAVE